MFKIESYITPIILSYVEKYVKIRRPQDSQVSLWNGEVSFQNLDLKLDVLEDELQLPFNLLSGHIHELIILVPWTKIASEPITITINTIEFVLKLANLNESNVREKRKRHSRIEDIQAPPGYMATLVNKIANNISIKCNNIILKYVEEDIVVSMNIQLLTIDSADSDWNPAFIDVSPIKILMRKIINVADLTICLDKRNAAGKIDVCQEPILYRCTLQLRMLRKYSISTAAHSSITRIDVFSKSMNLNISSQQFPMVMRLLYLAWNLKQGKIKLKLDSSGATSEHNTDSDLNDINHQSYFSWAWNLIPSIFPDDFSAEYNEEQKGHILHTGMYVDEVKIMLKSQEVIRDPIVYTTKKIKYSPFLKVILKGIYCDAINLGIRWFNLKGGVANIGIYPVGDCTCGFKTDVSSILSTENFDNLYHIKDTFFDKDSTEIEHYNRIYNFSWDTYSTNITEKYLNDKTPALALDMLHLIDIPDDMSRSSELGSDLEFSNLTEKCSYRIIIGQINFKYSTTAIHIIESLKSYFFVYDYPSYVEEKSLPTLSQLSPPSTDDYDALMTEIPLRMCYLVMNKTILEFYMNDHQKFTKSTRKKISIGSKQKNTIKNYLTIEIERFEGKLETPLYPNRLVYTTCQLPEPPQNLIDGCYIKLTCQSIGTTLNLICEKNQNNLMTIPNCHFNIKTLIRPDLWSKIDIHEKVGNLTIENIKIKFNRPQHYVFNLIINSIIKSKIDYLNNLDRTLLNDLNDINLIIIELIFENLKVRILKNFKSFAMNIDLKSIKGFSYIPIQYKEKIEQKSIILFGPDTLTLLQHEQNDNNLLTITIQMPLDIQNVIHPPIIYFRIAEISINIDPLIGEFLKYKIKYTTKNFENEPEILPSSVSDIGQNPELAKINLLNKTKKLPHQLESIHSSSDRDAQTITTKQDDEEIFKKKSFFFLNWYNYCKCTLLNGEIRQCTIFIPTKSLKTDNFLTGILYAIEHSPDIDLAVFKLPFIIITSSTNRISMTKYIQTIPIKLPNTLWCKDKDGFPWTLSVYGLCCYTLNNKKEKTFLMPMKTNITLAITTKVTTIENNSLEKNEYSLFFHIDTSPTVINLSEKQVTFLYKSIKNILDFITSQYKLSNTNVTAQILEIAQRPVSPESNVDLKEFLGLTNTSTSTKESMTIVESQIENNINVFNSTKMSILLQWTFTKFSINLYGKEDNEIRKLVLEFEDIISSVDRQNVYTKIKNKIGSVSCNFYQKLRTQVWIKNESLGFNMRTDQNLNLETNDTLFDLTITIAETGNVHTKWGTYKKDRSLNDSLTEIMIIMDQIDFRIDLNLLKTFLPIFQIFYYENNQNNDDDVEIKNNNNYNYKLKSVSDLPLIYLESKGFRIFLPSDNKNENYNVCILKVNEMTISHNVENPLTRNPVRPDIYTKAAQLRILNVPGSKIEDRQYEFILKEISITTGCWRSVLTHMESYNMKGLINENPAFDWNNKQNTDTGVDLHTIFKEFNLSLVYAPCIIFKNLLVSGPAIEINCLADLVVDINSLQLNLVKSIYENLNELKLILNPYKNLSNKTNLNSSNHELSSGSSNSFQNLNEKVKIKSKLDEMLNFGETNRIQQRKQKVNIDLSLDNLYTDSGIGSQISSAIKDQNKRKINTSKKLIEKLNQKRETKQIIPFEMWFVGGIFTINFYYSQKIESKKEIKREYDNNSLHVPIASISIFQPNMMISQTVFEKTVHMSIFDVLLCFGSEPEFMKISNNKFREIIFETRQGDLDSCSIQSPMFKTKLHENILKENCLNIEFKRPMKLSFSHKTLEKIIAIKGIINEYIDIENYNNNTDVKKIKPIVNYFKMKSLRSYFCDIKYLTCMMSQVIIDFSRTKEYDLKFSYEKLNINLNICERPEKINFNIILNSFIINTGQLIILHPVTMEIIGNLLQESWNKYPSIFLKILSNCIQIEFGPENISNIMKLKKSFEKCSHIFNKNKKVEIINPTHKIATIEKAYMTEKSLQIPRVIENVTQLTIPKLKRKSSFTGTDEFQDDLRAGAFQFIETHGTDIPLPYQILITNKDNGIICWRYPQPRVLGHIKVFPVPHTNALIKIICNIEYYSDVHLKFLPFCEFNLSENETIDLELPKRKVTASIWRVVMTQSLISVDSSFFEDDEDDDDDDLDDKPIIKKTIDEILQKTIHDETRETILNLHPKALVACMRIDSWFNPNFVPNLQLVIDISHIQINLINHLNQQINGKNPDILKQYKIIDNIALWQPFLSIKLTKINLHTNLYADMLTTTQLDFNLSTDILDLTYLNMQPLIENVEIKSFFDTSNNDTININLITTDIKIRYGPIIGHTLAVSEQIWRQMLVPNNLEKIIITRFIICNDTILPIKFGQFKTDELIYLKTKDCCFYSFRSDKLEQQLTIIIDKMISKPFNISDNKIIQYLHFIDNKYFIIKTEKISISQRKISIKGQIEFMNMTMQSFIVYYNCKNINTNKNISSNSNSDTEVDEFSTDFKLNSKSSTSLFGNCDEELQQTIKIKLDGPNKKTWSGEIPLQKSGKNNAPWLVKVPTNTKYNYVSFWVRVMRENITDIDLHNNSNRSPQRILITIWPLYMVKSMLSVDTTAYEEQSDKIIDIIGRGDVKELDLPGTHEIDHELVFNMNVSSPNDENDKRRALLSYKLVDKNKFFEISEKYNTIDKAIEELQKPDDIKWPCSREEELRWSRETSIRETQIPIFNCSLSRELSCSLMLTISPSGLFINSTGTVIKLTNIDNNISRIIDPNNVSMPFDINSGFTISIKQDANWNVSPIIYLKSNKNRIQPYHFIPEDGSAQIFINTEKGISKLVLTSINENGIKILILSTFYVITNFSQHNLIAWFFTIRTNDKKKLITPNDSSESGFYKVIKNDTTKQNPKGTPIINFYNLSSEKMINNKKYTQNFNYFMIVKSLNGNDYSCPIYLNKMLNKKCFNLPGKFQNIPLSVSIIEHQDQLFISIYDDICPVLSIENNTKLNLYVAQTISMSTNVTHIAAKECPNEHFDWYQLVYPKKKIYYTPPCIDEKFPDIKTIDYGLIFALVVPYNIRWSIPIRINETNDIFLKIPLQGDVKLLVDCKQKTTNICIDYISQTQEFCARDIRSRLVNPTLISNNDIIPVHNEFNLPVQIDNLYESDINYDEENTESTSDVEFLTVNNNCDDSDPNKKLVNLNIFIKEVSLIFYSDIENKQYLKSELISINFDDIAIRLDGMTRKLDIGCSNFQIDNQRYASKQYDFPVILCSQKIIKKRYSPTSPFTLQQTIEKCFDNQLMSIFIKFYECEMQTESIHLKLNPIRAYLEDTYLNFVLDYLLECLPNNFIYNNNNNNNDDKLLLFREYCPTNSVLIPKIVRIQSLQLSEPSKIRLIRIEPLSVLLSVHTCMRMYVALDHSPLDFSAFERHNVNTLPMKFGYVVSMHYLEGAAIGVGWVVGSLEILGSPSGLARSVSTGVRDFVSMPVQGLLRGPWGFIVGITQGSASLIKNITAGTVNSVTKLAASVSRNLDWLTLDEEHLLMTDSLRRSRPQGFTEGFTQGLTGLGISLLGAVGGLARHPLEAKTAVQIITGVGKGLVGAFTKPISGAAELVALTGQGMLHSVGYNTLPVPRNFAIIKNTAISPASCKIAWKLLPQCFSSDHILFSSLATIVTNNGLKEVFIGLTTNILTILSIETDQILEIIEIGKINSNIIDNDKTLLTLKIIQNKKPDFTDESTRVSSSRTFQFVKESNDQLPAVKQTSMCNLFKTQTNDDDHNSEDIFNQENQNINYSIDSSADDYEQIIELYMDPHYAKHLMNYICLIKRCLTPNSCFFTV